MTDVKQMTDEELIADARQFHGPAAVRELISRFEAANGSIAVMGFQIDGMMRFEKENRELRQELEAALKREQKAHEILDLYDVARGAFGHPVSYRIGLLTEDYMTPERLKACSQDSGKTIDEVFDTAKGTKP